MDARAAVLFAFASVLCEADAQTWVDRTVRPPNGTVLPGAGPDGGPVLWRHPQVLAWDGDAWQPGSELPTNVTGVVAMRRDVARNEVVAVLRIGSTLATHVLVGRTWVPTGAVTPQTLFELHDDPGRGLLGLTSDRQQGTTQDWRWTGTAWQPLPPNVRPLQVQTTIAGDLARGRLVAFLVGTTLGPETWEWDGTSWFPIGPLRSPSQRFGARMAFDANAWRVVVFGGTDGGSVPLADTWEWDGAAWTQRATATTPDLVGPAELAWDPVRGQLAVFVPRGPRDYVWDGTDWVACNEGPTGIPARRAVGVDPFRRVLVHCSDGAMREWDGDRWRTLPGASPTVFRQLAYDISTGTCLAFGTVQGTPLQPVVTDETWGWDGARWTRFAPPVAPPARTDHALLSWLPTGVILFGGRSAFGVPLGDTWSFSGGVWTERTASLASSPPAGPAFAANPDILRAPLVASGQEVWRWEGSWVPVGANLPGVVLALAATTDGRPLVLFTQGAQPGAMELVNGAWSMQQSPPFQLPVPALDPRYGTVLVFDRDTMFVRATPPHEERTLGTGCGQPPVHLFGDGAPRIGNDSYRLRVSAAPSAFVLFAMDAGSANTPLGNGCVQHVGVPNLIGLAGADALGTATVPVPLPWNPALLGLFANAQAAALQANGPFGGFALSPGLSIRVGN